MGQPQQVSVMIGVKDIYDLALGTSTKLDVLLAQHGSLAKDLQDHVDEAHRVHADTETRIRVLERARWPLPAVAVLIALASAVTAVVAILTR